MRGLNNLVGFLMVLLVSFGVFAEEQHFSAKDNGTIIAVVSQRELTRLVVVRDEIVDVKFKGGELEYAPPTDKGWVFRVLVSKPINGFIETKSGFVYKVIFSPKDIPATQIFVNNKGLIVKQEKIKEEHLGGSPLDSKIAQIVKVMRHPKDHLGYSFTKKDENLTSMGGLKQTLILEGEDEFVIAQKLLVQNNTGDEISLNKRDFVSGWLAVFLDKERLQKGEETILIRVGEK